jgi:hypothetical protein
MTKDQAKRLYDLQQTGAHILFTSSPYVAQMETGEITMSDDGDTFEYSDSALLKIDVLQESVGGFTAYRTDDTWQDDL